MQDKVLCPLTGKEITDVECFDIAMVVEGLAPENTIEDRIKPANIDKCRGDCMACKNHPQ